MEVEVKTFEKSSPITCEYWMNGNCPEGDACPNLHCWLNDEDSKCSKRLIWWIPPPKGFVKINCDGAFTRNGTKAAAGGVLRNCEGQFLFAFSSAVKVGSAAEAELLAIKIGMKIAISLGYTHLIVESDSSTAVQLINWGVIQQSHPFYGLVSSIIHMCTKVYYISCNHVYREVNSVADRLAKHGLSFPLDSPVICFRFVPPFLISPLCMDKAGKIYIR